MKVKILFLIMVVVLCSTPAFAGSLVKTIPVMAGDTIYGNGGASVFIFDRESTILWPSVGGASSFTLEFSGTTPAHPEGDTQGNQAIVLAGVTIFVHHYGTNKLPRGLGVILSQLMSAVSVTQIMGWETAVPAFAVDTGNSEFVYSYTPLNTRYHLLRITAGVTSISGSLYLNIK